MQTVGQSLDISAQIRNAGESSVEATARLPIETGKMLFQCCQTYGQQSEALIDVVMQFSGNPSTFFLLGFNQSATHGSEGFLGLLALGDIETRADVTGKGAVRLEPRHPYVENPSVFSVVSANPILHLEGPAPIKSFHVSGQAGFRILRVNTFCPAASQFCFKRAAGELQPGLIDVIAQLVGAGHPDHHWSRVGNQAKALFALPHGILGTLGIGYIGHQGKPARLTIYNDHLGGSQTCPHLTILPAKENLVVSYSTICSKLFDKGGSLIHIHPEFDLQRRQADDLISRPTCVAFESVVDL